MLDSTAADALVQDVLGERDPVAAVREGLAHDELETVRAALFGERPTAGVREMARALGVSEKTLGRRTGGHLTPQESDRLLLVAETFDLAVRALDGADAARAWLARPHALLDGEAPLARLDTLAGAREVQTLLFHVEYGMAA